ncbi:MAG: ATP-binding protein [Bacilli bacterium]
MKRLDKLLLVNWHYIVRDLLEFGQVTFLTGNNGAGKSTILDALQMILLGDTSGHFFNKAANDNSKRTLKGYLYGEVGEAQNAEPDFLRAGQSFASYVVAQFTDTVKKKSYCMGIVFDCEADGQFNHRFFSLLDELPAFCFVRDGTPLGIPELRQWGARTAKNRFDLYETNKRYQEMFCSFGGNIGEKFFRLFRKAVPFSPIMDVAGFISEFVCDVEHRLDIADMRENIRHYRRMESELEHVRKKVAALDAINQQAEQLGAHDERLRVYAYLLDRAHVEERERALRQLDADMVESARLVEELGQQVARCETAWRALQEQRDRWRDERAHSDVALAQERLHVQRDNVEARFSLMRQALQRQERHLLAWRANGNALADALRKMMDIRGPEDAAPDASHWPSWQVFLGAAAQSNQVALGFVRQSYEFAHLSLPQLDSERFALDLEAMKAAQEGFTAAVETLREALGGIQTAMRQWGDEATSLETVIAKLQQGVKPYPQSVLTLRDALRAGLPGVRGESVQVTILADALEIGDASWQAAIEGYLHTQKFYLLVDPEHFVQALEIYDAVKGEAKLFDVGLVDVGRIMEQSPQIMEGSLAQEVLTDDPHARAYVDFLLGRVMKCDHVGQLRDHRTSITKSGMLYQNFVARQLDPRRLTDLFIGKRALQAQLEQKGRRLAALRAADERVASVFTLLLRAVRTEVPTQSELRDLADAQSQCAELPVLQGALRAITEELGSLNLSFLFALDDKIAECERSIMTQDEERKTLIKEQGEANGRARQLQARRPQYAEQCEQAMHKVRSTYETAFAEEIGEPRFVQELQRLGAPALVTDNFSRQQQTELNRRGGVWNELLRLRARYNTDFQAGFDFQRSDNGVYTAEYQRLVDSGLPEYEEKIRQAKERAQVQFQEDFISKLRSNIDTVERQIRELNRALHGKSFGRDQYNFHVSPNPVYQAFYLMIMDELLMEGFGLFSQSFQDKHGPVVEELFRQLVDVDEADPFAMTELEKNLEHFTDYRTYLQFDLIVKDEEGRESRLSRVMAKKSGGETQTPFYISVLASFVQLYRVGRQGMDNTLRLIVFDEAYSKMDHQRIRESVKLVRQLGLQVILSAPTEKLADIAPLVDRTLIVTRIQSQTKVLPFDIAQETIPVRVVSS